MSTVIYTRQRPEQIRRIVALIPAILAGRVADRDRLAEGFKLRLSVAFLSLVKLAFLVKSRGGTDDAGLSWPKLTRRYLAYGRPDRVGLRRVNGRRVGTKVEGQLKQWRMVYAKTFARLAQTLPDGEAKSRAAAIAWARMKRAGVKTKLSVLGLRDVEILRDTGTLFNSLDCGIEGDSPAAENYQPKPDQIIRMGLGTLLVGTRVPYAAYHQNAKSKKRQRKLWPDALPPAWLEEISEAASTGFSRTLTAILRRMAP